MKRLCRSVALAAVAALLVVVPVLAAYYVYVVVESTGADYDNLALNMTLDVEGLVDEGYISTTGLDTRVTNAEYTVLPHMLADDKILWVSDLPGNQTTQFIFWTGQSAMDSFSTIAGYGGYVTINDTAALEPGGAYAFGIMGYFDTSAGANKSIIRKDGAVTMNITATGNITFAVYGGNSVTASSVSSGFHTIMVYCDTYDLWMTVDDVNVGNTTASTIPNTANDWYLFENNVMPYVSYYGEWVA